MDATVQKLAPLAPAAAVSEPGSLALAAFALLAFAAMHRRQRRRPGHSR